MKFNFGKRLVAFGVFNNRREKNGPEETAKAIDLPFRLPLKPREVDMLVPTNGIPLSQFLWGENLRKPELQTNVLPHIKVARKPEHLKVTIYDNATDKRKCLQFDEVKCKDPLIEIEQDGAATLTGKLQIHPNAHLQRIADKVEAQTLECEIKSTQDELFDAPDPEGDGGDGQQSLMDNPDGDGGDDQEND